MSKFFKAVSRGNIEKMRQIAAKDGFNINDFFRQMTPLHYAVRNATRLGEVKVVEVIKLLGELGADTECRRLDTKNTALHMAIMLGAKSSDGDKKKIYLAAVRALLEIGAQTLDITSDRDSALQVAVRHSDVDYVQALLDAGADPNITDASERTPLVSAAQRGNLACVELLLTQESVLQDTEYLYKSLFVAIQSYNRTCVKLLLAQKPILQDTKRLANLLCFAVHLRDVECIRAFLDAGINPNIADSNSLTPLYLAAKNGQLACVNALLEGGADVDIKYKEVTPLIIAAQYGRLECVNALLEGGAKVNHRYAGVTPLYFAAQNGYANIVALLLDNEADINAETPDGVTTPLHVAIIRNKIDVVRVCVAPENIKKISQGALYIALSLTRGVGRYEDFVALIKQSEYDGVVEEVVEREKAHRLAERDEKEEREMYLVPFLGNGPTFVPVPALFQKREEIEIEVSQENVVRLIGEFWDVKTSRTLEVLSFSHKNWRDAQELTHLVKLISGNRSQEGELLVKTKQININKLFFITDDALVEAMMEYVTKSLEAAPLTICFDLSEDPDLQEALAGLDENKSSAVMKFLDFVSKLEESAKLTFDFIEGDDLELDDLKNEARAKLKIEESQSATPNFVTSPLSVGALSISRSSGENVSCA